MKAVSLHQPWASLLVTRQPPPPADPHLDGNAIGAFPMPMVKRFEARSWPFPPALIGQPIAFHATKRKPERGLILGDWTVLRSQDVMTKEIEWLLWNPAEGEPDKLPLGAIVGSGRITASYQIPYGDFTTDRYAWLIEDAAPCSERCPWCWGTGIHYQHTLAIGRCPVCLNKNRCDPIPTRGRQRIWNWQP